MTSIQPLDTFVRRHLGVDSSTLPSMLEAIGVSSLDQLVDQTIPAGIRMDEPLNLSTLPSRPQGESEVLDRLRRVANKNRVVRSLIGQGYYDTLIPPVIQRNILENPGWYTQYTPYQAEISQGRLEALISYQTMVADLTGLPVSNASLLDEGTAAGEAMAMAWSIGRKKRSTFLASSSCHPQTLAILKTRAKGFGIQLLVDEVTDSALHNPNIFGVLLAYPATDGGVFDYERVIAVAQEKKIVTVMATDLLALTLLRSPGALGADIAVGSAQRFGVPLGYGGPHAGFMATREKYKRQIPGRIIGLSKDSRGRQAYRMALQTREQHIRREKATSNICTAQVLLAIMAGMYAVYHGPRGLTAIAQRVHLLTRALGQGLKDLGLSLGEAPFFDTLRIEMGEAAGPMLKKALERGYNLRDLGSGALGLSLDERSTREEVNTLLALFAGTDHPPKSVDSWLEGLEVSFEKGLRREAPFMEHPVFHSYHQEHEMLRYLNRLQSRDLSLTTSMIPLGSCTMKLNASAEMFPITWPEFAGLHPFAPRDQAKGYEELFQNLEEWLAEITGFDRISLQPNAGAQGEYTGLMLIRSFHEDRGEGHRHVCLIPSSAHGTNPASAVMAGLKVVAVACDEGGNIDVGDLEAKAAQYQDTLSSIMITYPSTHGVFEESIREICDVVHRYGGQVYLDGANMNAQVGLCRPGDYGADVCHLNLHKTFAIPHGGGGPGVGPVGVLDHLAPYLPDSPVVDVGGEKSLGAISAAPWGSAGVLPISWMYIALMGARGLTEASQVAILNANYMVSRLEEHFEILYRGRDGRVAHELIIDARPFKKSAGIEVEDIAKRLMDYGFHSPTMSWPVPGTLMIEPTESESKRELDRFCDAMIQIRQEIGVIEEGKMAAESSPLKNSPHTLADLTESSWDRAYSRREAVMPGAWQQDHKYWPFVNRIDNVYGDRHLFCTCAPVEMD